MIPSRALLAGIFLAAAGCAHSGPKGSMSSPPPRSGVFDIDGPQGRLSVDDGGRGGVPVLLVHGNGSNKTQWSGQLAHLRAGRRAAAFDLRGMGQSEKPRNRDYSVEGFAEDVAAVADALSLDRLVLVGHSFGGAVAGAYAGRHPERVAGLVFADTAGDLSATPAVEIEGLKHSLAPENYAQFTDAWFRSILKNATGATREAVLASLHATPREVFTGAALALYSFHPKQALARYRGPRLSIASYLIESPHAIHRAIEGIPARGIEGASHWLMMDRPGDFNRYLDLFLAGLK